jgi:hypothetical protein
MKLKEAWFQNFLDENSKVSKDENGNLVVEKYPIASQCWLAGFNFAKDQLSYTVAAGKHKDEILRFGEDEVKEEPEKYLGILETHGEKK